jgi:hypothetical protein
MRNALALFGITAAIVLAAIAPRASAAEPKAKSSRSTAVSSSLLQQMGLGAMQSVSDKEGRQVRGKGLRFYSANLTTVTGVNFGQVFVFQKTNVYSRSGKTYSSTLFTSVGF